MSFRQFLLILRARWIAATLVLLACLAVAAVVSMFLQKKYTATTAILVDVKSPDPVAGAYLPALMMPGYMATQSDIITSDSVAVRVVQMLKLDQNKLLKDEWLDDTKGQGQLDRWIAELLQDNLIVKPARESNVITLSFKSQDPDFSAAVANAFAQAYIEANIALSVEPAHHYDEFFEKRQSELRGALESAQRKLSQFQQSHGVVASDERLDIENQKLAELQSQYVTALSQDTDSESKRASAASDTLPEVLQSSVVAQLKAQIALSEAKLQDLAGNLGRNHPQYQRAEAELATLKKNLAEETSRVSHGVDTAGKIGRKKAAEIKGQMEDEKVRLLALKQDHNEMMVLQQEAEAAQKAFDAVSTRSAESHMQSQSNQTNISVLSKAVAPGRPSSPKLILNLAIAFILGCGMAAALILWRENQDRRLRSPADLVVLPRLLVLAELPAK